MKRFKRIVMWLIINGGAGYGLYLTTQGNEVASNIIKFVTIFGFIVSVLVLCSFKEARETCQKQGPSMPIPINILYDVAFACTLAGMGWFGYAGMSIFHAFVNIGLYVEDS